MVYGVSSDNLQHEKTLSVSGDYEKTNMLSPDWVINQKGFFNLFLIYLF